jgi:hypothetical protein
MKKKVYYHIADLAGWQDIMSDQFTKMSESGLLDSADEISICMVGNIDAFTSAMDIFEDYENIRFVHADPDSRLLEFPTLEFLHREALESTDEYYVLYCHAKGLTKPDNKPLQDWRAMLDYFMIEKWEECVAELDKGNEIATINWVDGTTGQHAHYQGNTWWVRASYLRKLKPLLHPKDIPWGQPSPYINVRYDPGNYKFDYEAWSCASRPKHAIMHTSPGINHPCDFHYLNTYPRELYATSELSTNTSDTDPS